MTADTPSGRLLAEWARTRAALAEAERAEHPDLTDRHGRRWVWRGGDLYAHDDTLAATPDMIAIAGLPSPTLAGNPNYARLCAICTAGWPGTP